MPQVQRIGEFTGRFHFKDEEEAIEWCRRTSFIKDSEVSEIEEVIEEHEVIGRVKVNLEVPADLWTGYCEEEPKDVRDVLKRVNENVSSESEPQSFAG